MHSVQSRGPCIDPAQCELFVFALKISTASCCTHLTGTQRRLHCVSDIYQQDISKALRTKLGHAAAIPSRAGSVKQLGGGLPSVLLVLPSLLMLSSFCCKSLTRADEGLSAAPRSTDAAGVSSLGMMPAGAVTL